jgi:threonine dehydratase
MKAEAMPSSTPSKIPPSFDDVEDAARRLRGWAHVTPVLTSRQADDIVGAKLFFKMENMQRGGAFKFRGAFNAISRISALDKDAKVIAFSSGNHAQAVALASRLVGIKATIVMPSDAPASKLAATRQYGADIVLYDRRNDDREAIAASLVEKTGAVLIPPFDDRYIIAGQGTAARELFEQVGELDYLYVPVGGGGLLAGTALSASALSTTCHVIGVEPETGNDVCRSFETGSIVSIAIPSTIADGAQTTRVGNLNFPIIQSHVHEMMTVTDSELRAQMRFFMERMKTVVEPTGCLGAAAAFRNRHNGARIGVIISGGNVDVRLLQAEGPENSSTSYIGVG